MISMDEIKERVILVAVDTDGSDQAERSLDELGELAATAGAAVAGRIIQNREAVHPGTYIGKGRCRSCRPYDPAKRKYPSGNLYRKRKNSGIKGIIVGDARNRNYL